MDIEKKIRELVNYYTQICGTNSPFRIAEYLGIHVKICPLGSAAGNYKYIQKGRWIFINSNIESETFRNLVMAHELGHALLHRKENCCFMAHHTLLLTSKIERQANLFAANLIITDQLLCEYEGCTKDQFCNCTGYPEELLELRIGGNNYEYNWKR